MKIQMICQTEDSKLVEEQLSKQTMQPDIATIEIDADPAEGINERRKRIVENHKKLVHSVRKEEPDLVWQIEGDSVLPEDCLERLYNHWDLMKAKDFGFISGIQVSRHGIRCIGAWHVADDKESFHSVDHNRTGIVRINAAGFYCLLSPVWLEGECSWNDERWGPDVNWGLSLQKKGYKNYVDMDLEIGHQTETGVLWPSDYSTTNVKFWYEDGWTHRTRA